VRKVCALLLAVSIFFAGCSFSSQAKNFNGLTTPAGKPIEHLSTTNVALHLLFKEPLVGDATLQKTVDDFTAKAKADGAKEVRIVQSNVLSLWFILPPISIIITPTITKVAGDAIE
jgi:hypothetical protein